MGSYTPLTWAQPDLAEVTLEQVVRPTLAEMAGRGTPFVGCLYVGLALTETGPRVIEFNVRFGDPDIQPVLAVLDSPLGELLAAAADRSASATCPRRSFRDGAAVTVVLASAGYPESSSKGDVITGVDAGRRRRTTSTSSTPAPRCPATTWSPPAAASWPSAPSATDVADARATAYAAADLVSFPGMQRRIDIAAEPLGVVEGASLR